MLSCVGEDSLSSFPQKPHLFKMEFKKKKSEEEKHDISILLSLSFYTGLEFLKF